MRVLVACEFSGVVRRAFAALGHDAYSCDILPSEDNSPNHFHCDVLELRNDRWDLMIAHPPCTFLARSGIHWNDKILGRPQMTEHAVSFVKDLWGWNVERIALENPIGILSSRLRMPDQIIQPYDFGDDASKATCLWLKNLPKLKGTKHIPPRKAIYQNRVVDRWANQTASGNSNSLVSDERQKDRSRTYEGIAAAMAAQWSVTL